MKEFEWYGIRADDKEYKIGEICELSHNWWQDDPEDGSEYNEELHLMDPQELNNMLGALVSNCPALKKVCETWGEQHMLTIAMEENAELIQAISKIKRNGYDPINASHLDEETADVLICICELFAMDYLDVREIAGIIERKVERAMRRTQDYVKKLEEEAKYNGSF